MLKFLSGLFTSDKIVDAGISGLDKIVFTSEEKAELNQKADELRLEFVRASAPMEVSRRFIAVSVTIAWCINGAMCMLGVITEVWLDWAQIQHPEIFKPIADFGLWYVMPPFTAITSFYFWKKIEEVRAKKVTPNG